MKRSRIINVALVVALVATGAGIYAVVGPKASAKSKPTTVDVATGTVLSSVSASGTVVPSQQLGLNFLSSGVLLELDVKLGDKVTAGQVLAKIDPTSAQNSLTVAQAQLTAAQDNLTSLQTASTSTTSTTTAPSTSTSGSAQAAAQAQAQLSAAQSQLQHDSARLQAAQGQLAAAQGAFAQATAAVNRDLAFQQQCLANPATPPSGNLTCANVAAQLQIDTASQASAQAAVVAAGVNVNAAQQAVSADQAAVTAASAAVAATKSTGSSSSGSGSSGVSSGSGSSTGQGSSTNSASSVAQAEATVTQDQINVQTAQKALDATTMTAPVDGTVSALNGTVGQSVTGSSSATASTSGSSGSSGSGAGSGSGSSSTGASSATSSSSSSSSSSSAFLTLTNLTSLQVSASFTEADATKLVVGQKAIASFSALPNVQVQGEVAQIATTSTTSNGVVSFAVLVNLDSVPPGLKPGMSATAQVIVGESDNAVYVPASAVTGTGANGTVTVVNDNGTTTVTQVTVGLRGDTTVEITSGLQKGQKVVRSTAVATTGGAGTGGTGRTGTGGTGSLTGTGGIGGGGGGGGFGGGGNRPGG